MPLHRSLPRLVASAMAASVMPILVTGVAALAEPQRSRLAAAPLGVGQGGRWFPAAPTPFTAETVSSAANKRDNTARWA